MGRKAFKVDGKALRVRTTMVPRMRTDGTSTASRSGCSGSRDTVEIESAGGTVATMAKKALVSPLRDGWTVNVAGGED